MCNDNQLHYVDVDAKRTDVPVIWILRHI